MSNINNSAKQNQTILFDTDKNLISIEGVFITENPVDLFADLNLQIDDFFTHPSENLALDFKIEYFSTNMSLIIRNLLRKLHDNSHKTNLKIRWYFELEDEDMEETGEEFNLLYNDLNFEVIGVDKF